MTLHREATAFYDEDWTAHCACGAAFYARYRADAEDALRKHIADEGIAAARAELEGGVDGS